MKKLLTCLLPSLTAFILPCSAQNPIVQGQFSADPTAKVFDGQIYLYPSHDIHFSVDAAARQDWFCMADYHCFTSKDLTEWTDCGRIIDQAEVPWGNPKAYSMWAPDCVKGKDGRYYFFFPDAPKDGRGFGVGVAISNTPYGPFKAEPQPIKGVFGIDPCVLQTSKGENYLFWGGGGLRVAKLNDNLLELAEEEINNASEGFQGMKMYGHAIEGLPDGFKEGPFAFERNGKFYLTYPWVRTEGGTECLAYSMSDNPMGPYEYKGIIMAEHANGCWTNHHSIVEYNGQWYLFYHHNDFSPKFDKNRSVCCDSLSFNPDGTIVEVKPTLRGVGVTDASGLVQMDRYSSIGGGASIAYNDTTDYFKGWKVVLPPGGWVTYGNVKMPQGQYKTWVAVPGFFGRMQTSEIGQTSLKLTATQQSNGLSELRLVNEGKARVEVDWITLNANKPLVPASQGGMITGAYRNVFAEMGYPQNEIDAKLQQAFNDVFEGKNKCYFKVGKDLGYISDIKNKDVRTEGMSYGMMIAVQFGKKDIFDRLWRWSKKYMQMEDGPHKGYFRWSCKTDGTPNAQGPASDGELYYITSLIFASNKWGNDGDINYLKEAQYILDCIQPHEVEMKNQFPGPGNMVGGNNQSTKRTLALIDPKTKLIAFVPGSPYTDPSYHLPAFYEVWARYAEDGRASYWRECAQKSREYLRKSINPVTGLNPDYNNFDGTMLAAGRGFGAAFRYDSWRVPMNIALDYSWACADPQWQRQYGHTFQNFLYSQGVTTFVDQYNVDGTTPNHILRAGDFPEKLRHGKGLVATAAAASLLCSHSKSKEFVDQLWNSKNEPDEDGYFDAYYDALLRLFAFMHLSGNYRVIEKTPQLSTYLKPATTPYATPDEDGFIRRWTLRNPVLHPTNTNTIFVDSFMTKTFPTPYIYKKNDKEWNTYDSQMYNTKLYRLATGTGQQRYGVIFWATTVIECEEDIENVRLAAGSNSASKWWLNGKEALLLSGDRRMVKDDGVSNRLTLKKGRNVITGAVINGPGMSDFCLRFIDSKGNPVTNYKVTK